MNQTNIDATHVQKLAVLSNLDISPSETTQLVDDLQSTVQYVQNLEELQSDFDGEYFTSDKSVTFVDGTPNSRLLNLDDPICQSIKSEFIVKKVL